MCRETFKKTLEISTKRINTALGRGRSGNIIDKRSKLQDEKSKISEKQKKAVKQQISKILKYESHYRRETCSNAKFLPPEMTLSLTYQKYKTEVQNPVSFQTYRRVFFTEFNLNFKSLKKNTCNTCGSSNIQYHNAALPLPQLPTGILFYKEQIWLYNLGIHVGSNNKSVFNIWIENKAGRVAQEIGSCILKYIKEHVPNEIKELILWSDSCENQNRNIKMCPSRTFIFRKNLYEVSRLWPQLCSK